MSAREIKFRAWSIASKTMADLKKLTPLALSEGVGDGVFLPFKDGIILMQYTGLSDKNGKDIYEGDIVSMLGYARHFEVVFNSKRANFCLKMADGYNDYIPNGICEVIGNIYENPELINGSH